MPKLIAQWNPARDVWEEPTMGLFCEHSDVYSATWPSSGMTQGGTAYELPTSAHPMAASASSSLLPTPTLDDAGNITRDSGAFQSLTRSIGALLPTPAVNDMGEGKTVEHWDEWTATMQAKHGNGNSHGKSLAIEAQRLLPTPSVADGMGGHMTRSGARSAELLLPGVAKLIGARTPPLSPDGSASSDDPRPHPLSLDPRADSDSRHGSSSG